MSRSLAANCGSVESLKERTRWGCSLCARQMRRTEETLIPVALAIAAAVQWVAWCGGSVAVSAITRSMIVCCKGGIRDGRVLSRRSRTMINRFIEEANHDPKPFVWTADPD